MLELEHGFRVVDVHTRLDPDEEAVAVRGRQVSPERLEREMHQAGVERAAASPGRTPRGEGYLRANNAVARLSIDRPIIAFARLGGPRSVKRVVGPLVNAVSRPRSHHTTAGDVEQYAYDDRYHGFTLDPAHDGLPTEPVLDELAATDDPVVVHGGEQYPPSAVAETLLDRGFPVVLSSFGGYPLNEDLMRSALDLLGEYDDLYLDTAYVPDRDVLEKGLLEHPDRILFGSGAPSVHPNVGVMEILTLDVPEDAMRRAFTKNPARVVPGLLPDL
ncbi:amidohydrolase family protein [Halolamina litorea]|uniref:Amidohydrolase family protein n=1 Tax=Halolamina litorea TaxID=1515593 RepID=A0ABD6BQV3_9EURY|nr:amidohydrolase family protein [Halolamina litorea]